MKSNKFVVIIFIALVFLAGAYWFLTNAASPEKTLIATLEKLAKLKSFAAEVDFNVKDELNNKYKGKLTLYNQEKSRQKLELDLDTSGQTMNMGVVGEMLFIDEDIFARISKLDGADIFAQQLFAGLVNKWYKLSSLNQLSDLGKEQKDKVDVDKCSRNFKKDYSQILALFIKHRPLIIGNKTGEVEKAGETFVMYPIHIDESKAIKFAEEYNQKMLELKCIEEDSFDQEEVRESFRDFNENSSLAMGIGKKSKLVNYFELEIQQTKEQKLKGKISLYIRDFNKKFDIKKPEKYENLEDVFKNTFSSPSLNLPFYDQYDMNQYMPNVPYYYPGYNETPNLEL